jgi:hypothetical protein
VNRSPAARRRGADKSPRVVDVGAIPAAVTLRITKALEASRMLASRSRWPLAVVVAMGDELRVEARTAFAMWLREQDLDALAHECIARRVPPGAVLVYGVRDDDEGARAGFVVFPLLEALAHVAKSGAGAC